MNRLRFSLLLFLAAFAARGQALLGPSRAEVLEGRMLARTYCVTCHLFPEPDAVDRRTWHDQILPRMKYRLGFSTPELEQSQNIRLLRELKRIPEQPVITEAQWLKLANYYFAEAPETPLLVTNPPPIAVGVPGFKFVPLALHVTNPAMTAVKILPGGGALVADDLRHEVWLVDRSGRQVGTVPVGSGVAGFRLVGNRILAAGLGSFQPTDERRGGVFTLGLTDRRPVVQQVLLTNLPRTTDALEADLNGDAVPDFVVSSFGNNAGRLAWYQGQRDGTLTERELFALPGAIRAEVSDVNADGKPDVLALVAQETEAMFLFVNQGDGEFARQTVFQQPPHWGHSHFELADFNGDGRPDLLVANGDNGEFNSPPKRIHGLRIYTAQTNLTWRETWFFPQPGAYRAMARDFDGDGDLDIASVAYFADYKNAPRASCVLLVNDGRGAFTAHTFAESATGRWVTMDAGDFDGDGDDDLLLGSFIKGPTPVPAKLMEVWEQLGAPLLLLENQRWTPGAGGRP